MPVPSIIQIQQFKYNPYSIVQATKQSSKLFDMGLPMPSLGPSTSKPDQILYNPIKNTSTDPSSAIP